MDSAASVHVFFNKQRFSKFWPAERNQVLQCGGGMVTIRGWGWVTLLLQDGRKFMLVEVAYIPSFPVNLMSLARIQDRGIHWAHHTGRICDTKTDRTIGYTKRCHHTYELIETRVETAFWTANSSSSVESSATADIWHRRMGHIGPLGLYKLGKECLGMRLKGKTTAQCPYCALSKITQRISRRPPINRSTRPFHKINLDWQDLEEGWDGYQGDGALVRRTMAATCDATGMAVVYFVESSREDENLPLVQDLVTWLSLRYNLDVKIVRSDNELNRIKTKEWMIDVGITFEPCAPDTHAQNGVAERFGRLIMEKARAMRLSAGLPHRLWREIVGAAAYLYNRTPREALDWKSPYEVFHTYIWDKEGVTGPRKPQLHHLKAYGCKCYTLIKSKGDPHFRSKRRKLDSKAHIGFLVGYESTNIYRVWIPHKRKVISVRDVIFDEDQVWDGQKIQFSIEDIKELDDAIEIIEVPQSHEMEDIQLGESDGFAEESTSRPSIEDERVMPQSDNVDVEEKDDGWKPEDQYPTPAESDIEAFLSRAVNIPVQPASLSANLPVETEGVQWEDTMIEPAIVDELNKQQSDRYFDFKQYRVPSKLQTAFVAGMKKSLPPPPQNYKQLRNHPYEKEFQASIDEHLRQHREQFNSWSIVDSSEARGHQVLGCQWVFVYKTGKHGELIDCKARLVVCGNQQWKCELSTRATTLASTALRVLLALIARFDLETLQLDAVNAFVHADLDEVVFVRVPPGYKQPPGYEPERKDKTGGLQGKVLRLNKALYGLRRSPILWQQKLTAELRKLGFEEVPQEPCIMQRNGIIIFFFVDDVVTAFRKNQRDEVMTVVESLSKVLTIKVLGELKWFLGMHIVRNRKTGSLWISQKAYIERICTKLMGPPLDRPPTTPMDTIELLPAPEEEEVTDESRTLYQQKIGSILFAAISTRPDISFAASRLSRFNKCPGQLHHRAAERTLQYLYNTRSYCIRYGSTPGDENLSSFICASDASFADNILDRKSSQGYIMKLFNGAVAWRANKQDTVTTSSTEAEFLAISQTAKETIYLSRLMNALTLVIPGPLAIECDNAQTIRLLVAESLKLQTKLRHVDIHSHWLRQEVQRGSIRLAWVPTKRMIADGLTKSLTAANFAVFVRMMGLDDKVGLLAAIEKEDTLRQTLQEKGNTQYSATFGYGSDMID